MTIEYEIPQDQTDQESYYSGLLLSIDEDGDVFITDDSSTHMLSYAQAKALHYSLGQGIIRFDREFGHHHSYKLKEVSNG